MECSWFTGGCSKVGAVLTSQGFVTCANAQFSRIFLSGAVEHGEETLTVFV